MSFLNEFNTSEFNANPSISVEKLLDISGIICSSTVSADLSNTLGLSAQFDGVTSFDPSLYVLKYINIESISSGSTALDINLSVIYNVSSDNIDSTSIITADLLSGVTVTFECISRGKTQLPQFNLSRNRALRPLFSGVTTPIANLIVGNIETLSTTINGITNITADLLVGNLKTFGTVISAGSALNADLYRIVNDSSSIDNFVLWNDSEHEVLYYGTADVSSRYYGTYAFKGQPTSTNRPGIRLNLSKRDVDISGYDQIWFFARTENISNPIKIAFSNWPYNSPEINISSYTTSGVLSTNWQLFKIPFSVFETTGWTRSQGLDIIYFGRSNTGAPAYNIYIDNIRAVDTTLLSEPLPFIGQFKSIFFDEVPVSTSKSLTTYLENIGLNPLNIASIDITGANASEFSTYIPNPNNVDVGQLKPIEVNFFPSSSGSKSAQLKVTHTSTLYGHESIIDLFGTGIAAEISLQDTDLDFGTVPSNESMTWNTRISNIGNTNLLIFDITSSNPDYTSYNYDTTVAPNSFTNLSITYDYSVAEAYINSSSTVQATLSKTRDLQAIISGSTELDILLGMDIFPFGISEVICSSTVSANLGVAYRVNPENELFGEREIFGISEFIAILDVRNGFNTTTFDASSLLEASLSVTKPLEAIIDDNSGVLVVDNTDQEKLLNITIDTTTIVTATLTKVFSLSTGIDTSSHVEADLTVDVFKWISNGSSNVIANMSQIKTIFGELPPSNPAPIYTILQTTYPWQHNDVYSYDPGIPVKILSYTTDEADNLIFDKANKTGETRHGTIALLSGIYGDLVDSGVHPDDLGVDVIDGGSF